MNLFKWIKDLKARRRGLKTTKFTMADVCCGLGGFTFAGIKLFDIKWAVDTDKYATQVYKQNFPDIQCFTGDLLECCKDYTYVDIMTCGFPCQPFSIAGKRQGLGDPRGNVFEKFLTVLKKRKPRAIVLENVDGLVWHAKGATLSSMLAALHSLGYVGEYKVFNAIDFGLHRQSRKRVYMVFFSHENSAVNFKWPVPKTVDWYMGSVRHDLVDSSGVPAKYFEFNDKIRSKFPATMAPNDVYQWHFGQLRKYDNVVPTLTAGIGGQWDTPIVCDPATSRPRSMTVSECAKIQGLPEGFVCPVSNSQAYRLIGNSVSIYMTSTILRQVHEGLMQELKDRLY
jgi:DNA (cytosine-5)-methyltransferase 1